MLAHQRLADQETVDAMLGHRVKIGAAGQPTLGDEGAAGGGAIDACSTVAGSGTAGATAAGGAGAGAGAGPTGASSSPGAGATFAELLPPSAAVNACIPARSTHTGPAPFLLFPITAFRAEV